MVLYSNSLHSQGGGSCACGFFERGRALEQGRAVALGPELWAATETNDPRGAGTTWAMPMSGPGHLWLLLNCNSAAPGNPEWHWIINTRGPGNLGNFRVLGSLHSPQSSTSRAQCHGFHFRSLLVILPFLFPAKALPGVFVPYLCAPKAFRAMVGFRAAAPALSSSLIPMN